MFIYSSQTFINSYEHRNSMNEPDIEVVNKSEDIVNLPDKIQRWFDYQNWHSNPFILSIIPSLLVGYEEQKNQLLAAVHERHKVVLVLGPTGSGKTNTLEWLMEEIGKDPKFVTIFLSKPPTDPKDFIDILTKPFVPKWLRFLGLNPNIKNFHDLPEFLNKKLKNKHLVLLCDEIHETNIEVLQWLRVLSDQVDNITLIMAGLPNFEKTLKQKLETFYRRVTFKIVLSALTKEEIFELIEKRIGHASDGKGKNPFSQETIDLIYEKTGGFPREVLRLCDRLINTAMDRGVYAITPDLFGETKDVEEVEEFDLMRLPQRQREIIEALRDGKTTPSQIVASLDLSKYKSKEHAIRSVNNILKRLMDDGFVDRERQGKTFIYKLSPKIKAMLVKA